MHGKIKKIKTKGMICMGTYLNPGNIGFECINKVDYVDKTGMIDIINKRINTTQNYICLSRPRRFGKTFATHMLSAYYDHSCDSRDLFYDKEISKSEDYERHINKYNVIYLDMSHFLGNVKIDALGTFIIESITNEILNEYKDIKKGSTFEQTLINVVEKSNRKFIMIIDEWDAPIREIPEITNEYLLFLRTLFKSSNTTPEIFAAAYMTGILPIKKDGSESAVSDFDEYSVLESGVFSKYTGFTEEEVKDLCKVNKMDFDEVKKWYDGYNFGSCHSIYNPYSVMQAMFRKKIKSYWRQTSKAEALKTYVMMNMDDLQNKIVRLIAGEPVEVYTEDFENDFRTFNSSDDVLTLMIHLGYLAYDDETKKARIPNEELRLEFERLLNKPSNKKIHELVMSSEQLLKDTLDGNEEKVVDTIVKVRELNYAPMFYNNEQALRYVIKFAYIICIDYYLKVEELPTGKGIADVVFIPKKTTALPAMIVELKWNKTADSAIKQIKDNKYPILLDDYTGEVVLVGINYDEKNKQHSCKIERKEK